MIVLAGMTAFYLRRSESVQEIRPVFYALTIREYLQFLLIVAAVFVILYAVDGLYNIRSTKRTFREIYQVFRATTIGLMLIIVGVFLNRDWYSSRFVILSGGALVITYVSLSRIGLRNFQRYIMVKKGIGVHKLLLIGINGACSTIKRAVSRDSGLGYKVVAQLDAIDLERIERIRKIKGINEIIECNPNVNKEQLFALKEYSIRNRITFRYVPTLIQTSNFDLQIFLGEPMIEIKNTPLDGWGKILKRAVDIVGALVGLVLFGPLMLLAAFLTWLDSGRPVIFLNERVGHRGNFDLYKFRYMRKEYCHGKQFSSVHNKKALAYLERLIESQSVKSGPVYKIKDDPRKTRIGKFLEKFSIDELPQFFNVLKGEMSLVGPRPHQPIEVSKYEDYQKRVLTIKPGITGMAQVSGRSDLEFKDEVKLDTYYIENWSLWLDLQIIFKTAITLWKKRKN